MPITEQEAGLAVLQILSEQSDGEASLDILRAELPKRLSVNDQKETDELLRLIKSHDTWPGNIFRDYLAIVGTTGGWQITPNGLRRIKAAV